MLRREKPEKRNDSAINSPGSADLNENKARENTSEEITGILSERIKNLQEAIDEIDSALASRKVLSDRFLKQIGREMAEIYHQLRHLQPPWKTGFYPQVEFLRLSLHKSLTSRRKDIRSEELKYWEDVVGLLKEKRKFLDEYKALLSTKKRLVE